MRRTQGGIPHVAAIIKGLVDIATSVLAIRNINTSEIASILPRDVKSNEEGFGIFNVGYLILELIPSDLYKGLFLI